MPSLPSRSASRWTRLSAWLGIAFMAWFSLETLLPRAEAGDQASPATLKVTPAEVHLIGPDSVQQLAIEETSSSRDLTSLATFASADESIAVIDESGLISAQGDGETTINIRAEGQETRVPISVRRFADPPPIHFTNQVVPIFTKLGCNAGGCHGKSGGQNGFRLSLLGFEPDLDYMTLVHEGRGRRLFPAAPDQSLLLTKATGVSPHGGGKRLEADSHEYRLIRRWIAEGMTWGDDSAPTVARIEIDPSERTLTKGQQQQLLVTAHYTDGSTEDVTRWAQYESNETEVVSVEEAGRVHTAELPGQAAVMARYQGQVAVFRGTVPLGQNRTETLEFVEKNQVDTLAVQQWKALGLVPSEPCTDAEYLRRVSLDITGTLPTAEATIAFVEDSDPQKRDKLVDRLLERPEYASFFALKWSDILRNKRENNAQYQRSTYRFYDWIRQNLDRNVPFDEFARQILAANGTPESAPPTVWYRQLKQPDEFVDDTAQVFLGMRLQCAKCHHHPFEKWSEDDYYSFAAFFARVGRKDSLASKIAGRTEQVIFTKRDGAVRHPKSNEVMSPRGLGDSEFMTVSTSEDPRHKLVDWMTASENPFFAKAVVNRYWAHFFNRGLVEPIDDLRETNPPSNPDLLNALAEDFIASGYDLKHLIRTICQSQLYGLSSLPNDFNATDKQSFARYYPKRMSAEVLLDAISDLTGVPTAFNGLPTGTRAIELPDESVNSNFLDTFGRPKRDTACECERVSEASLSQSLMLLNSSEVQSKLSAGGGRAAALASDSRPEEEKLAELVWSAFGRPPSESETATALEHLETNSDRKKEAYEDLIWALINAKEFQFID